MKKIIIKRKIMTFFFATFCCTAIAQITNELHASRDFDVITKQQVANESAVKGHDDILADMTQMEVVSDNHRMKLRFYDNDSVTVYKNRMRYDYRQTDDSLQIIGSEGHCSLTTLVDYSSW